MIAESTIEGLKGNPNVDFLEYNSDLKYVSAIADIYRKLGKEQGSKLIWSFILVGHPGSQLYRAPIEDRKRDVEKNYFEGTINWDEYKEEQEQIFRYVLPKGMLDYKVWREKYDELNEYLTTLKFATHDKQIIMLFEKAEKMYAILLRMETLMTAGSKDAMKGGGSVSKRESRKVAR